MGLEMLEFLLEYEARHYVICARVVSLKLLKISLAFREN